MGYFASVVLAVLVLLVFGFRLYHRLGHPEERYTEDYAEKYGEQLRRFFGSGCVIGEEEVHKTDPYVCDCGYRDRGRVYSTWKITYKDSEGMTMCQTMDNVESLAEQKRQWFEWQLENHFTLQMERWFPGALKEWSTCEAGVDAGFGSHSADGRQKDIENMCLNELNYQAAFNEFPVCVEFYLVYPGKKLAEESKKEVRDLLNRLCEEKGQKWNFYVEVEAEDAEDEWTVFSVEGGKMKEETDGE